MEPIKEFRKSDGGIYRVFADSDHGPFRFDVRYVNPMGAFCGYGRYCTEWAEVEAYVNGN
ncbi:hypothetical protein [Bifidobacterium tissieri]|uniref:Uncharacterized protein n=1 Tax=Bifidobacterium tissieri TaxID=1630162 RepID=A0A5M9ZVH3_9BIFI|nr:hypothetical protein [Bifidobacterium tissieri]KAA8829323.1 hypothetical protein EM849_10965 [Bifidobacterium tissieri]KAA8831636.1 hypothetical protein EMO89_02605 [Bifidobacterium tissieri]